MSVGRGIQSVIFYYLSCAPCTKVANRRNRKRQSDKDKSEREAIALQNPNTYRQPSPFRTNEYWAEEIRAGPGPPIRRLPKKERKRRQLERDGRGRPPTRKDTQETSDGKDVLAVPEPAHLRGLKGIIKNNQNRLSGLESKWKDWRRFQREDEELWGGESMEDLNYRMPDSRSGPVRHSVGGSSVGVPGLFSLDIHGKMREKQESYWVARHPPVNDLHPPVVSVPNRSKPANQWMLQPPPPSAVMNGYRHSRRYRSDSETGDRRDRGKKELVNEAGTADDVQNKDEDITAAPTTPHDAIQTDSPALYGALDTPRHQQHGDSGVDVSGSSDQSTTSQDNTVRHDFAYTPRDPISTVPPTTSRIDTKRKHQTPNTSHTSILSSRSKKASRVAMPIRSPLESSEHNKQKFQDRPRLARVLSSPTAATVNYVSLDRAQLDGLVAVMKPHKKLYDLNADDGDDDEADAEDEEDLVDPLDSRPSRRKRGHTEGQMQSGNGRQNWRYPDPWALGNHGTISPPQEEEDFSEDEDETLPDQQTQQNYFTLPAGPSVGGRRWSFDL